MDHDNVGGKSRGFFASRTNLVVIGFLAVAGFYLIAEHRAHVWLVVPWLPWLLLLACPLMHLFMHHGHGSDGDSSAPPDGRHASRHKD